MITRLHELFIFGAPTANKTFKIVIFSSSLSSWASLRLARNSPRSVIGPPPSSRSGPADRHFYKYTSNPARGYEEWGRFLDTLALLKRQQPSDSLLFTISSKFISLAPNSRSRQTNNKKNNFFFWNQIHLFLFKRIIIVYLVSGQDCRHWYTYKTI